jgi:hypothetical protein
MPDNTMAEAERWAGLHDPTALEQTFECKG